MQSGRRERQSDGLRESECVCVCVCMGQKWFLHGLKMAIREIEHLSIFSNANQ
jgi:hypothetical protein